MTDLSLLAAADERWASLFWDAWSRGEWSDLAPDEREYGQHHLASHLAVTTEPRDRLACLVELAWRDAWRALDPSDEGFLRDVDLAWEHAGDALELEIRCCLSRSTAGSVQAGMPQGLLALSVSFGFLAFAEALQRARRTPDEGERATQLEELVPVSPEVVLPELLAAANEIDDSYPKARALAAVAGRAGPTDRMHIHNAALRLSEPRDRARVLAALLPREPAATRSELATELLGATDGITLSFEWREILQSAVAHFPADRVPALIASASMVGSSERSAGGDAASVLVEVAGRARPGDWPLILDALSTISGPFFVSNALVDLASSVPPEHRAAALELAGGLKDPRARLRALKGLGGVPSPALDAERLAAARGKTDAGLRAEALAETLDALDGAERRAVLDEAMVAARAASMPLQSLVSVAVRAPDELRREALDCVFEALDGESNTSTMVSAALLLHRGLREGEVQDREAVRRRLLAAATGDLLTGELLQIAELMDDGERLVLLERAHREAREINNAFAQIHVFRELLPATPAALLDVAIDTARAILDESERAEALVALAARVPHERALALVAEARSQFTTLLDESQEAEAIVALAAFVDGPTRNPDLLHALERLAAGARRERFAYGTSDRHTPGSLQDIIGDALRLVTDSGNDACMAASIRAAALVAARAIGAVSWRANALGIVGRYVTAAEFSQVWGAASDLGRVARIRILTERAAVEEVGERRKRLREAIALASEGYAAGKDDGLDAADLNNEALGALARLMDGQTAPDILRLVAEIPSSWWRTQGLRTINPFLTAAQRRRARAIANEIPADSMGLLEELMDELDHPPERTEPWQMMHPHELRRRGEMTTEDEWNGALALGPHFVEGIMSIGKTSRLVDLAARSLGAPEAQRRGRSSTVLRHLAHERRPMVLREIAVLAPLFASVYRDQHTALAACDAVRDVCSWPL